ncbi:hypothetical protein JOF29_001425 [Kribbella aluminosa]|uniref:Uncharacterized protein n=1 Tax=Kribbella aluminosa TaxID=416017 RepID=A0ABS4UFB5_9ACTN|nr:hypothetical protein [Kribbella aluminosa]
MFRTRAGSTAIPAAPSAATYPAQRSSAPLPLRGCPRYAIRRRPFASRCSIPARVLAAFVVVTESIDSPRPGGGESTNTIAEPNRASFARYPRSFPTGAMISPATRCAKNDRIARCSSSGSFCASAVSTRYPRSEATEWMPRSIGAKNGFVQSPSVTPIDVIA